MNFHNLDIDKFIESEGKVMNYISAEQFLKLPGEVQKVFMKWWQPQEGDRVIEEEWTYPDFIKNELNFNPARYAMYGGLGIGSGSSKHELIPLFRLDQLIDFIQDETGEYIKIDMLCDEWTVTITFTDELLAWEKGNLLEVLWKAAVKVAEMKVRGNDEDN